MSVGREYPACVSDSNVCGAGEEDSEDYGAWSTSGPDRIRYVSMNISSNFEQEMPGPQPGHCRLARIEPECKLGATANPPPLS